MNCTASAACGAVLHDNAPSTFDNPDAALILIGRKWRALLDAINAGQCRRDGEVTDEAMAGDEALRQAIAAIPAHTAEGVLIKLHVVWEDRIKPNLNTTAADWYVDQRALHSAIEDLERMTGA